jgi:hypothetical protein
MCGISAVNRWPMKPSATAEVKVSDCNRPDSPKISEAMFFTSGSARVKLWVASSKGLGKLAGTLWRKKA